MHMYAWSIESEIIKYQLSGTIKSKVPLYSYKNTLVLIQKMQVIDVYDVDYNYYG